MKTSPPNAFPLLWILPLAVILTACRGTPTPVPTPTATQVPSATVAPAAIRVNGEQISVTEFTAEVDRYRQAQAGLGTTVSLATAEQAVQIDLVDTLLLAQGAASQGYGVDDASLESHIQALVTQLGSAQALSSWEAAQGYTDADFRTTLRLQIAAAWMRDTISASVPLVADQVHVKQILVYDPTEAQNILSQLQGGTDFDSLAALYDPVGQGDLGWFPRGYLSDKAIEAAAFALKPGNYSGIIQSGSSYRILYLIEEDPAHPLSPDALLTLQENAVQAWLTQRRSQSTIVIAP
jgi:hypothetical protein